MLVAGVSHRGKTIEPKISLCQPQSIDVCVLEEVLSRGADKGEKR